MFFVQDLTEMKFGLYIFFRIVHVENVYKKKVQQFVLFNWFYNGHTAHINCFKCENIKELLIFLQFYRF